MSWQQTNIRGQAHVCPFGDWTGEASPAPSHYAKHHCEMDEVLYGCQACGSKAGRLADLESHILTKTHQLNAKNRTGEEILIKKRGRAAILLSKFQVLSAKESQKIWTKRKKNNQESNTDEEQLKVILETG